MDFDDQSLSLSEITQRHHTPIVSQLFRRGEERHHVEHAKARYHIEQLQCFQLNGLALHHEEVYAFE